MTPRPASRVDVVRHRNVRSQRGAAQQAGEPAVDRSLVKVAFGSICAPRLRCQTGTRQEQVTRGKARYRALIGATGFHTVGSVTDSRNRQIARLDGARAVDGTQRRGAGEIQGLPGRCRRRGDVAGPRHRCRQLRGIVRQARLRGDASDTGSSRGLSRRGRGSPNLPIIFRNRTR
jgi:hypothetical protein